MAETVVFEKVSDFAVRKIRTVEIVEEINYDALKTRKEALVSARQSTISAHAASLKWFDDQIADIDAALGEASKLEVVSEKEYTLANPVKEEILKEEPTEEIIIDG